MLNQHLNGMSTDNMDNQNTKKQGHDSKDSVSISSGLVDYW